MMKSTMQPIHSLIEEKLRNKSQIIQSLTSSLHSRLPVNLRQHCWVVDITGNTLVLVTDIAERATVLRYQQHELVKQINEEFSCTLEIPLRRVKIKVDYKLSKLPEIGQKSDAMLRSKTEIDEARNNCKKILNIINSSND